MFVSLVRFLRLAEAARVSQRPVLAARLAALVFHKSGEHKDGDEVPERGDRKRTIKTDLKI